MTQMVYSSDGRRVIATHRPSGEARIMATAATPQDAEKAAAIINRGMFLNDQRRYTDSARKYAELDAIPGYKERDW